MLFCLSYLSSVLAHDLNKVGHGEVHDVVLPCELQDDVRMEEIVTLEETSSETVVSLVVEEI